METEVYTKSGTVYHLEKEYDSGTEGAVWTIVGDVELFAKIYKESSQPSDLAELENKLQIMCRMKIDEHINNCSIAWPKDILYKKDSGGKLAFAGYTMRRVLANHKLSYLHFDPPAGFHDGISWKDLIQFAYNLSYLVKYLHENGVQIGDFNEENFLFTGHEGGFHLIDCGNYGLFDTSTFQTIYACRYSMPEYTAPETLLGIEVPDPRLTDAFYLAIQIFRLLMGNSNPFAFGGESTDENSIDRITRHIENGDCLYVKSIPGKTFKKHAVKPGVLPDDILEAFDCTFNYSKENLTKRIKHRTTASQWCELLKPYVETGGRFVLCSENSKHTYSAHLSVCPWCHPESVSAEPYELRPKPKPLLKPKPVTAETTMPKLVSSAATLVMEMISAAYSSPDETSVNAARGALKVLSAQEKAQVTNLNLLEEAETIVGDRKKLKAVIDAIKRIEQITDEEERKKQIRNARFAYSELPPSLRQQVTNEYKLRAAERDSREPGKGSHGNPFLTGFMVMIILCAAVFFIFKKVKASSGTTPASVTESTAEALTPSSEPGTIIGTLTFDNGTYEGSILNDQPHGYGTYKWNDGDVYEGQWINGEESGKGVKTWADGATYSGDFLDGCRTGQGTYTWPSGNTYTGDFVNNKRTGHGTYTWANGNTYTGDFLDGQFNGKGTLHWADGNTYTGDFLDDQFNGKGTFNWADGDTYTGDFLAGKRTGQATYTWPNGNTYTGSFVDGAMEGFGKMTYPDGTVKEGQWSNNKFLG